MPPSLENITILFTGDLSITGVFHDEVLKGRDFFSDKLSEIIQDADYCVCNFEGPATNQSEISNTGYRIVSSPHSIEYLLSKNIGVFNLANNHIFDCGLSGFMETTRRIAENKGTYFGAGLNIQDASQPIYLERKSVIVALIGISQNTGMVAKKDAPGVFSEKQMKLLKKQVAQAKKSANWVIVNSHGGEEYTFYPSPLKRKMALMISELPGVDIVICHHSHTFQGIEIRNRKTIFYSLGNFVFDFASHHIYPFTDQSAIVSLEFSRSDYTYTLIPTKMNYNEKQIQLADKEFIKRIETLSDFSGYRKKWMNEAERVLFNTNYVPTSLVNPKRLQNKSLVKCFFQIKFYKKIWLILHQPYMRSLYIHAVLSKIFK